MVPFFCPSPKCHNNWMFTHALHKISPRAEKYTLLNKCIFNASYYGCLYRSTNDLTRLANRECMNKSTRNLTRLAERSTRNLRRMAN